MAYTYLVPQDTARLSQKIEECPNFGLKLARFIPEEAIKETKSQTSKGTVRNDWLKALCSGFKPDSDLIASTHQRWLAMTEGAARFTMTSRSRMIVGLGGKGALEFGITLHPVTGLPYIPGSALKGLCRNYALLIVAESGKLPVDSKAVTVFDGLLAGGKPDQRNIDQLEPKVFTRMTKLAEEYGEWYRTLFGTQGDAGDCVFFDAVLREVPDGVSLFAPEVMTPHFRQYYESGGKLAPHDADNLNPILFVTVNADVQFHFAIGLRKNTSPETPLREARTLLQEALQIMGIGAKTAAGYGVFTPVKAK